LRREWRWALVALVALAVGTTCAEPYSRFALPYYRFVATTIARFHAWRVMDVMVVRDASNHGGALSLSGEVRRHREDTRPLALVVSSAQVGEVVESPLVYWTLLLLWPAATRRWRLCALVMGIPVFLVLEAVTTPIQLVYSMARASAILAGEEPLTVWERWSQFLEAGGRFALEAVAAVFTATMTSLMVARARHVLDDARLTARACERRES
jgi:hypothetical protein